MALLTPGLLQDWKIVIIGDGELKCPLQNLIADRGLSENFELKPFVPYEEMPQFYAESDLLILPSIYDPNPLSVVDALHCGLPIALPSEAGNVDEAVSDGKNGWVLPVNNKELFSKTLEKVFSMSRERLCEMGRWSIEHNAKFWDTERTISKFLDEIVGPRGSKDE